MRKVRLLILSVVLLSMMTMGVNASNGSTTVKEIKMGNTIFRSMEKSSMNSDDIIIFMSDSANRNDNKLMTFSQTFTSVTCDSIELRCSIQKKSSSGSWSTVQTFTFTATDDSYIDAAPTYYGVESGYTYRTQVVRYASVDNTTYSDINWSAEIPIS